MARQMKDSGIEWIGEIPDTWEVKKNKYLLLDMYSGGTPTSSNERLYCDDGIPFVSISDMSGTDYVYDTKKKLTEEGVKEKNLRILDEGTIIYSIYATIGAISELKIKATISQAMLALSLKSGYSKNYYKYNLEAMKNYIFFNANGNTQFNLNAEKVWNFTFVAPSIGEQERIANYLDQRCAHIDAVIEKTKASIEEYKKLKQAVITQAVTKGIRGDRPMKDSGIEWIGEIPADWDVLALKYLCSMQSGKNLTSEEIAPEGNFKVYGGNGVRGYYKDYNTDGDYLLIGRQGALCGNVHHVNGKFWATEHAILTSTTHLSDINFLFYLLIGMNLNQYVSSTAAQPGLAVSNILNIRTCLVPISEQEEIACYLDAKCSEMDVLVAKKETFLAELETYKKSLIYEYVTGKKEVPQSCQ